MICAAATEFGAAGRSSRNSVHGEQSKRAYWLPQVGGEWQMGIPGHDRLDEQRFVQWLFTRQQGGIALR